MEKTKKNIVENFFSIWGMGDIPLGKKLFWSFVFYMLLFINYYIAGALFLFLVVLYKKRGEEELKCFMNIHGTIALLVLLFGLAILMMVAL